MMRFLGTNLVFQGPSGVLDHVQGSRTPMVGGGDGWPGSGSRSLGNRLDVGGSTAEQQPRQPGGQGGGGYLTMTLTLGSPTWQAWSVLFGASGFSTSGRPRQGRQTEAKE
jgi:hypothetical protein